MSTSTAVARRCGRRERIADDGRCERDLFRRNRAVALDVGAEVEHLPFREDRGPPSETSTRTVFEPTSTTPTGTSTWWRPHRTAVLMRSSNAPCPFPSAHECDLRLPPALRLLRDDAMPHPSGASSHACELSARSAFRIASSSFLTCVSSIGITTSMRWSRLRGIRSALPSRYVRSSPASKQYSRLCSRKRPRTDRTRIDSLSPSTPGNQRAVGADDDVDLAPACGRLVQLVDHLDVGEAVAFEPDTSRLARFGGLAQPRGSAR